MPRVNWDTEADFDAHYGARGVAGYVAAITYDGAHMPGTLYGGNAHIVDVMAQRYHDLGIGATDRVLIAGSAFGYIVDALVGLGHPNVVGLDNSAWIDTHPNRSNAKPFRKADIATGQAIRNTVRAAFGELGFTGNDRDPQWIITESVLESYEDAELGDILTGCALLVDGPESQCVHVVTTTDTGPFTPTGVFNEKTLAEWNALAPAQTWMNYETGEVL